MWNKHSFYTVSWIIVKLSDSVTEGLYFFVEFFVMIFIYGDPVITISSSWQKHNYCLIWVEVIYEWSTWTSLSDEWIYYYRARFPQCFKIWIILSLWMEFVFPCEFPQQPKGSMFPWLSQVFFQFQTTINPHNSVHSDIIERIDLLCLLMTTKFSSFPLPN